MMIETLAMQLPGRPWPCDGRASVVPGMRGGTGQAGGGAANADIDGRQSMPAERPPRNAGRHEIFDPGFRPATHRANAKSDLRLDHLPPQMPRPAEELRRRAIRCSARHVFPVRGVALTDVAKGQATLGDTMPDPGARDPPAGSA